MVEHIRSRLRPLVVAAMLLHCVAAQAALPADWRPELRPPPEGQARGPRDPFLIELPVAYDQSAGRLALELDNVDVTSRVRPVDETYTVFRFTPYTPLTRGGHVLRMVEYTAAGEIIERGRWTITVSTSDSGLRYGANGELSRRLDERPGLDGVDRTQASGSARVSGYHDNGERRYEASAGLIANSAADDGGRDERALELARFLASRESAATRIAVGEETVGQAQGMDRGNLIFDGAARRGVSGTVRPGPLDSAVTLFAQRTEPISGFEHGLGVGDADNRINGGFVSARPFDNTAIGVGYITGEGRVAGAGTAGESAALEGRAANVVVDSAWLDGDLSLRAEAAGAEVDPGAGFDDLSDRAHAATLRYRSTPPGGGPGWRLAADYLEVGPDFRSIAALGASADLEQFRLQVRRGRAGLPVSYGLSLARAEDNVDDRDVATTRKQTATADLRWEPRVSAGFGGGFLGRPVARFSVYRETTETVDQPAAALSAPTDTDDYGYNAQAGFDHPLGGRWNLGLERRMVEDEEDLFADTRSDTYNIGADFGLLDGDLQLSTQLVHDVLDNRDSDETTRDTEIRISEAWAISRRVAWNLDWTVNHVRTSDDSTDERTQRLSTDLNWRRRPVNWWLSASYETRDEDGLAASGDDDETYQVFAGLSFELSGGQ